MSTDSHQELTLALTGEAAFDAFLAARGWFPDPAPLPLPERAVLTGARLFHSPDHDAPRLLVLFRPDMSGRAVYGNELRKLQGETNRYRGTLEAEGAGERAPSLCLVATDTFLVIFPLDGNPFARRQRYTPERLRPGSPIETSFRHLTAAALGQRASVAAAGDALADILGTAGRRTWDLSGLVAGAKLDEEFVSFMSHARRRITSILLDTKEGKARLKEMWPHLKLAVQDEEAGETMPKLELLVREGRWRRAIIASVDTVLLRLVLYRYLEAQFGYRATSDESRQVAVGSYDELLAQTTRFDEVALEKLLKKIHAGNAASSSRSQLALFAPPVTRLDEKQLQDGLRRRADHYQASAGGDLHHGSVADAADLLQDLLVEKHAKELALLLEETRTDRYSFHYADLDARAFGEFYQSTIGTDIRAHYDRETGDVTVGVVEDAKNQKEHGAYYTEEKLSGWLIERTLGKTYEEWLVRLDAALRLRPVSVAELRALLGELTGWRIIDPTVGSGVFLRGAFEFLSRRRDAVMKLLRDALDPTSLAAVTADGFAFFRESAGDEGGDWEWHILLHMLYGVDVDVKAVNVASNLLTLSALSYKRHGLCFPSFINTSLKRGNALVPLLRAEEREMFAKDNRKALKSILKLRKGLRNANLKRSEWKSLHAEVAALTRTLVQGYLIKRFRPVFDGLTDRALVARVQRVGVFFYEAEFPEVFFDDEGQVRADAGFDVVLGNPPWEEPAAELKQFLPEYDETYLAKSGKEAERLEKELLSDKIIGLRWEEFQQSVEDYKAVLTSGWYEHQRRQIRGRFPGAHTNLYKYATEVSWKVLKVGGRAGLVLDGGLWGDLASSGLRALLLDQSATEAVCGFINRAGIFPGIDRRMKFGPNVFRRGGRTTVLSAVFMRESVADLAAFDRLAVPMDAEAIRTHRRGSYPVPEVRSVEHYEIERGLAVLPILDEPDWQLDSLAEELNAGRQREFFHPQRRAGFIPLVQGEQFNLFGVHQGELPGLWLDPSPNGGGGFVSDRQRNRLLKAISAHLETKGKLKGGKEAAALAWVRAVTGKKEVPAEWIRLDWDGYRIAWRDIARNDDRRTLIAGILPPRVALSHTAPFVRPFRTIVEEDGVQFELQYPLPRLLYLAGMLSSFTTDAVVRSRLGKTHLTSETFLSLPVPPWSDTPAHQAVAELTARLTCLPATAERPWADYTDLAAAVGLDVRRDGLVDVDARRDAEVELNARVAELYGLSRADFRFLMDLLFMTPAHRDTHASLRDAISARMPADVAAA